MNIRIYAALFFAAILFIMMPLYLFLEDKAANSTSSSHPLMICLKKDSAKPIFFTNNPEEFKPIIDPRLQRYCLPLDAEKENK
ncbi:hypothetical protein [Niallia sp. NCCP-28]|uniref:hypothetical protein n=1 Tax=Niallia sp. NCCP-28 TaxID=2934712 RepID=UPI00207EA1FA|nr:hypothetical protein [Niallia sp. NCCP-28]GKU82837.1 hypothetical protein NCCP28_22330 [Niallia sp. NCCP-28]